MIMVLIMFSFILYKYHKAQKDVMFELGKEMKELMNETRDLKKRFDRGYYSNEKNNK